MSEFPRAYLRMSPNLDQHPDPLSMVRAICAANRQPDRGRFREEIVLERAVGRKQYKAMVQRGDVVPADPGPGVYLDGWDEWQEGDMTVAERMRRHRSRKAGKAKSGRDRTADWRLKNEILARDGFACRYCGAYEYPREHLVAEHVVPSPRGKTAADNLVTACIPCNVRKGSRTPEEAGMVLHDIGYRSRMDPLGDTPRVTRQVTYHDPSQRVTVTTTALDSESNVGTSQAKDVGDTPPPQAGQRKNGTNPRALGTNPRANGTSPRQQRTAEKRGGVELLGEIMRRSGAIGAKP